MSYAGIRDALVTRVQAVSGIGNVWPRFRWFLDDVDSSAFATIAVVNDYVNVWFVSRTDSDDTQPSDSESAWRRRHEMIIVGFFSVHDADNTEGIFQVLVDAIRDNLRTGDRTLGGAAMTYSLTKAQGIGFETYGPSPILCHTVTIKLTVEEVLS